MTIEPARSPRLNMLTTSTMAIDSHNASMKSLIAWSTVSGWLATIIGSMPIGRLVFNSCMVCWMLWPSASTSPPSRMEIDKAQARLAVDAENRVRRIGIPPPDLAMSARRTIRLPTAKLMARMSFSDFNAPLTCSLMPSLPVVISPEGATAFCACSASRKRRRR